MNVNSKAPMALYKANLELVLRIGTLLQESRQRWMQSGAAGTNEAIQRTLAETERMLTTNDWTSLSAMPGQDFWTSLSLGANPLQGSVESAVRSQAEFADGLRQAFAEWQQQSAAALGGNAAPTAPWAVADFMQAAHSASPSRKNETAEAVKPAKKKAAPARNAAPARKAAAKAQPKPTPKASPKKKSAPARKSTRK